MTWPICMESLDGPRPVYKKKGFRFSYRSRMLSRSLMSIEQTASSDLPLTEEMTSTQIPMWLSACQSLESFQCRLVNSSSTECDDEFIIVHSIFIGCSYFKGIDNLFAMFLSVFSRSVRFTMSRTVIQGHLR